MIEDVYDLRDVIDEVLQHNSVVGDCDTDEIAEVIAELVFGKLDELIQIRNKNNNCSLPVVSNSLWVINNADNSVLCAFKKQENAIIRLRRLRDKGHLGISVNEMILSD